MATINSNPDSKMKQFLVTVTPRMLEEIDRCVEEDGVGVRTEWLRGMFREYLKKREDAAKKKQALKKRSRK
jgi:metal-responsive CopG/Arc/MetJ family transcriptional regulator